MTVFDKDTFDFLDKQTRQILLESREAFVPHAPYCCEKNMMEAVRKGDIEAACRAMDDLDESGLPGKLSDDPVRQEQILFIAFMTLITRAAMDAGVSEDLAYAMSDSYIRTADKLTSAEKIRQLKRRAIKDFAGAAKHRQQSPPYSKAVRRAVQYICGHIQEKLSVAQIAQASGVSESRIAHLFKDETGISLMAYAEKERLETAVFMLLYTDYSISKISNTLCFPTESYFIRRFKENMGCTPGKYRKMSQ